MHCLDCDKRKYCDNRNDCDGTEKDGKECFKNGKRLKIVKVGDSTEFPVYKEERGNNIYHIDIFDTINDIKSYLSDIEMLIHPVTIYIVSESRAQDFYHLR